MSWSKVSFQASAWISALATRIPSTLKMHASICGGEAEQLPRLDRRAQQAHQTRPGVAVVHEGPKHLDDLGPLVGETPRPELELRSVHVVIEARGAKRLLRSVEGGVPRSDERIEIDTVNGHTLKSVMGRRDGLRLTLAPTRPGSGVAQRALSPCDVASWSLPTSNARPGREPAPAAPATHIARREAQPDLHVRLELSHGTLHFRCFPAKKRIRTAKELR